MAVPTEFIPLSTPPTETLEDLYEHAPCGYVSTLPDGTLVKVNQTFLTWSGYDAKDIVGVKRLQQLLSVAGQVFHETHYAPLLAMQGYINGVAFDLIGKQGKRLSFFCNSVVKRNEDGSLASIRTILFDAGDRRLYEKELLTARRLAQKGKARLEYLAEHDYLTNLPNRHSFAIKLEEALGRVRARAGSLAILFVDLDRFKDVNDSWGHEIGDLVLVGLAQRFLADNIATHSVARMGGEEFVFLLENEALEQAQTYANALLADLSRPFEFSGAVISVGASIGIAVFPEAGATGQELMRNADRAMYSAKMSGGFRVLNYTAEAASRHAQESLLRQDLPKAVQQRGFVLHYHAKIDLRHDGIVGAEALLRWKHPDREQLLYPAEFLQLVEASPVRYQVFAWTIDEVCRQMAAWERDDGITLPVSINLSAWQLADTNLCTLLEDAVVRHGIPVSRIELEITEGALIADKHRASEILGRLAERGFTISLDDFGTGYSGLAYIKQFPIRGIKIDKTFVQGLGEDQASRVLAEAIVVFGKSIGMEVLAEGVETVEQRDFLKRIGCDAIQGFLIAKPLPADEFRDLVKHHRMQPAN